MLVSFCIFLLATLRSRTGRRATSLLPSLREAKLERLASDGGGSVGGAVAAWVPLGHDVYVIGVQECLALDELRRAIHARLGGDGAYRMYTAEIGSTK